MEISIRDTSGRTINTARISRSYPNAKSTKFVAEIEWLLSAKLLGVNTAQTSANDKTTTQKYAEQQAASNDIVQASKSSGHPEIGQQQQYHTWQLTPQHGGITATLIIPEATTEPTQTTKLMQAIKQESDNLQHDPHTSDVLFNGPEHTLRIVNILCTTHHPPGLSMKDVRLASEIDEIVNTLNNNLNNTNDSRTDPRQQIMYFHPGLRPGTSKSDRSAGDLENIVKRLQEENLQAAARAVADLDSKCARH